MGDILLYGSGIHPTASIDVSTNDDRNPGVWHMNDRKFAFIYVSFMVACVGLCSSSVAEAGFIDSINPNAVPADSATMGFNSVGFYYTPTQSYTLTGISTYFAFDQYGSGVRTVTAQIQSSTPASGGVILDQGTFTADNGGDNAVGASFATPIQLTAGTTYFIDFLNIAGLGSMFGQYQTVNGLDVPVDGATTRLAAEYQGYGSDFSFSTSYSGNGADEPSEFGNISKVEPILLFSGTSLPGAVPEPSSLLMLTIGLGAATIVARRQSH
jgi:hypothetical protein